MKERGSAVYQVFLLFLSIYVLIVLFVESFIVVDKEISIVLQRIDLFICLLFLLDFFVNLYCAESKIRYLKWGWLDLAASIPMLDPLRWGRLARIIRIVRFLRTIKSLKVLVQAIMNSRFQSLTLVVLLITFVTYTVCASLIIELERGFDSELSTADSALWWAFLNLMNAKVSFEQARSAGGVFVTIVLNKVGLLVFAYFNAIFIAWLVGKRTSLKNKSEELVRENVERSLV